MPFIRSARPTNAKTLGLSALAGTASEGASQILKKITGGSMIPSSKINQLASYQDLLTKVQRKALANAIKKELIQRLNKHKLKWVVLWEQF